MHSLRIIGLLLILILVAGAESYDKAQRTTSPPLKLPPLMATPYRLVPPVELETELCNVPQDNRDREEAVAQLFIQAGATASEIHHQPLGKPDKPHNIYVVKPGRTDQIIVVGGHLDHVDVGTGVIDDWTGVCLTTNLYQTLKDIPTEHTFIFIGFAEEETGLRGSRFYVQDLSDAQKQKHQAMINLECLGTTDALIWINGSDKNLATLLHDVAQQQQLPLMDHKLAGVGADSNSFRDVGIAAMTVDGLPQAKFSLIHSTEDTCDNVDVKAYYRSYQLMAAYLMALDKALLPEPTK